VQLGPFLKDAWYYSPYPVPGRVDVLYVCEKTFKYATSSAAFRRHRAPETYPGVPVYRDATLTVMRVEGAAHRLFCQNLSLLGKLFIEHKTLHYDPSPFYFFLVLEHVADDGGGSGALRPVGYFSKEKESLLSYNLACIVTFPPHQRKGVGKFIISLSYEISKREGKVGSPEKPLSDLGKRSYRSFWAYRLLGLLSEACVKHIRPTVQTLAQDTGIRIEDVISTLQVLGFIKHQRGTFVLAVTAERVNGQLGPFLKRNFGLSLCDPAHIL
jgi:histone acetyltransferase MYST1